MEDGIVMCLSYVNLPDNACVIAASSSNNVGGAEWVWCTFILAIDAVLGRQTLGDYIVTLRCSCNTVCTITCDSGMPQFILERDVCTVTT